MSRSIKGRIFLVGCPRSGTTLLQSLIASQAQIMSFPESHFFAMPGIKRWHFSWLRLGFVPAAMRRNMGERLQQLAIEMQSPELQPSLPVSSLRLSRHIEAFVGLLDGLATKRDKHYWLEKTPSHLYFAELIERHLPDAQFIHLVRNGQDVVASLYEVTHQYPQLWGGTYDLDQCIARWNRDLSVTERQLAKANHILVRYEQLVQEPAVALAAICRFIGAEFSGEDMGRYRQLAKKLSAKHERWKDGAQLDISSANGTKFERLFDPEQQAYILGQLRSPKGSGPS